MAKWEFGRHVHKRKDVKGVRNGREITYYIVVWRNWYDTSDVKQQGYSVTWQEKNGWSFNGGYGTELKTNIRTLTAANKVVASATAKIKKHTKPFN